jgi:hypothetical protein
MAWTIRRAESHRDTKPTGLDGADNPCKKDTNSWDWKVILHSLSTIVFISEMAVSQARNKRLIGSVFVRITHTIESESNAAWDRGAYL